VKLVKVIFSLSVDAEMLGFYLKVNLFSTICCLVHC